MNNIEYSLMDLFPDFPGMISDGIVSPAGITALFWIGLTGLFLGFLVYIVVQYFKSISPGIKALSTLVNKVDRENPLASREQVREDATKLKDVGAIWIEFDESLVESFDRTRLFNTYDAAHFFNTHTLARNITESRLIAAVPGFLTALGVIGTFGGLALGLQGLSIVGADTQELKQGIGGLIGAASIAFITSVWGVLFSVLFNAAEKSIENRIKNKITALQDKVDFKYPRITAERSLEDISGYSRRSEETLGELAEKIGNRMQEAMLGATAEMSKSLEASLERILSPAIGKLVDASSDFANKQSEGSEKALESLLTNFVDRMGESGAKQREIMDEATHGVRDAFSQWGQEVNKFTDGLSHQFDTMTEIGKQQSDRMQDVAERMQQDQSTFVERLHQTSQDNIAATAHVVQRTEDLGEAIALTQEELAKLGANLATASNGMSETSKTLESAYSLVADTNKQLARATTDLAGASTQSLESNQQMTRQLMELSSKIELMVNEMQIVTDKLTSASQHADSTFSSLQSYQQQYIETLDHQVKSLAEQLSGMLKQYGTEVMDQTSNRLQSWDRETVNFTNAMQSVVQTIQEIVEDLEEQTDKVR